LTDEYDRSSVISMIGILGEIAGSLVEDETWAEESIIELREGCELWAAWLRPHPAAERIAELLASSRATRSRYEARQKLLEAAELAIRTLWQNLELRRNSPHTLNDVRARLASDLKRDLDRVGKGAGARDRATAPQIKGD
jgi:hypothetical protein